MTGHRRENFREGFESICNALADIASAAPDVEILYPVHLNPNLRKPVAHILAARQLARVHLFDPVDYLPFVYLMNRAHLIITDSGGVQKEAPSLGKLLPLSLPFKRFRPSNDLIALRQTGKNPSTDKYRSPVS